MTTKLVWLLRHRASGQYLTGRATWSMHFDSLEKARVYGRASDAKNSARMQRLVPKNQLELVAFEAKEL